MWFSLPVGIRRVDPTHRAGITDADDARLGNNDQSHFARARDATVYDYLDVMVEFIGSCPFLVQSCSIVLSGAARGSSADYRGQLAATNYRPETSHAILG